MSFLTCRTNDSRFLKAARTVGGADLAAVSALETLAWSEPYARSIAFFEVAKLPEATARSSESPTVSEVRSSVFTARHSAAFDVARAPAEPTGTRVMRA